MPEPAKVSPEEASDLRQRVLHLEDAHADIKERFVKQAAESRDSFARVHDRIDELKQDVTITGAKLDMNTQSLVVIQSQLEPVTDIQTMLRGLRRFIRWVGTILTTIVALWSFLDYLRHLPH